MSVNIFIKELLQSTEDVIVKLRKQRNSNICIWLCKEEVAKYEHRKIISTWKDIKYIDENYSIDNNLSYYEWDTENAMANPLFCGLRWVIARSGEMTFCVVTSQKKKHDCLIMFRDAPHLAELPDSFIKVKCFNEYPQVFEYCKENDVFKFTLEDRSRFVRASGIEPVQGAIVYKELKTNNLWYLDMLHKNHYEVFDSTGKKHLGEADMEGFLDVMKKDSSKKSIRG